MTTACCSECGEDINVGTAGLAGLSQHMGKSKCQKNIENKKKKEKQGMIQTLFNVGVVKKGKDIPQDPLMPEASSSTRKALASPLPIIVYPSKGSSGNAPQPESLGTKEHQGCLLGWEIIDQLRQGSKRIKLNILIAEEGDEIAMYAGRGNAEVHCAGINNNKFFLELPFLAQHIHFRKEGYTYMP